MRGKERRLEKEGKKGGEENVHTHVCHMFEKEKGKKKVDLEDTYCGEVPVRDTHRGKNKGHTRRRSAVLTSLNISLFEKSRPSSLRSLGKEKKQRGKERGRRVVRSHA